MKSKKSLVYTLIFLLTFTSIIGLFSPVQATDDWTPITLPYTITAAGNYRITASWFSDTVDAPGLIISASDVVVDGQNYAINLTYTEDGLKPSGVYAEGQSNILLKNINTTSSYYGIRLVSCSNFTINNCSSTKCMSGVALKQCHDFTVNAYNSSKDLMVGVSVSNCENFTLDSCNAYYPTVGNDGIYVYGSNNFLATNLTISRSYMGFTANLCNNYILQDSSINRTGNMGFWGGNGQNATVTSCTFNFNTGYAIYAWLLNDFKVTQNTITNNSQAIKVGSSTVLFSDNYVATNGIYEGSFYGGFYSTDSTCTLTGNTFDRNYDAFMWVVEDDTSQKTCNITDNAFQSNAYTFYFYYTLPAGYTNQKLLFSNNLVNDTAYFDINCLNYCTLPIADKVVNLNSTSSLGFRPYSNGPQVGGNFWAFPNGNGFSQTGTDANHDGFIDASFDLFNDATVGSAIDNHPYSTEFDINTWVPFTLPATISQPGNYRLASSWSGNTTGLVISASNVILDGQDYQIQLNQTQDISAIILSSGSSNVTMLNINETGSDYGLWTEGSNFTVQDSVFTNNTSGAIFAYQATDFSIQHSLLSNNSYGVFAIDSSNFSIVDSHVRNSSAGIQTIHSNDILITNCYLNNNTYGIYPSSAHNFTVTNCSIKNNTYGLLSEESTNLSVNTCSLNDNDGIGFGAVLGNFTLTNSQLNNNSVGMFGIQNEQSYACNLSITNNDAGMYNLFSNGTIENSEVSYNKDLGMALLLSNATVRQCSISNCTTGISAQQCTGLTVEDCSITNTQTGFNDYYGSNTIINSNLFSHNGLDVASASGALMIEDSNCTVTNNLFEYNYDALLIGIYDRELNNTIIYHGNTFKNNNYTFDFNYQLPSNFTNQQICFYNNFVNDSAYLNLDSFTNEDQYAPPSTVFHLNATLQAGTRIYTNGPMIGGNYWAYPNGTGSSQTGTDANKDGFIDSAFDFFGNQTVYDYLPYSVNYQTNLIYTSGASQSLAANQSSALISIQTVDYYGAINPGTTVTLSSNSTAGKFYSDAACTQIISSITIPAGSSTASFYYKDLSAGTPVLTVSSQGMVLAATTFTIALHATAIDHIAITPDTATIPAGTIINYTTTAYDIYCNAWNVDASYTVNGESFTGNALIGREVGVYYIQATYEQNRSHNVNRYTWRSKPLHRINSECCNSR